MNERQLPRELANLDDTAQNLIDGVFADMVTLRRYLHAHPELSGEERETVAHLRDWLNQHGVDSEVAAEGCGILVNVGDGGLAKCLALRADLDALHIQDKKHVHYRSQVDQVMHACGHDVHATILAGALFTIHSLQQNGQLPWSINLRAIFQPAEETCSGAKQMIAENALKDVNAILAFHVDPMRDLGCVALRPGVMTASCDEIIVTIRGQGGHAARPHHTRDPITAVAQFINAVHVQLPRGTDSLDTIVIGFGRIVGGEQCNVIPDSVELRGTLRTLAHDTRTSAIQQLHEIAAGIGRTSQTQIEIGLGIGSPAVHNDAALIQHVERIARRLFGEAVEVMTRPSMGAEDFAYYLDHVPGALVRLGTRSPGATTTGLHTAYFDVNEEVIRVGMQLMVQTAIEWFAPD
jgi:amidohydrolase